VKKRYLLAAIVIGIIGLSIVRLFGQQASDDGFSREILQGVKAEKASYGIGEQVKFFYAVRNITDRPITYTFPSGKRFELWVKQAGRDIYTLSKHMAYTQAVTTLTLQPDETNTFTIIWNQQDDKGNAVGPGSYAVCAQLVPKDKKLPVTNGKFTIGGKTAALVPLTVKDVVNRASELLGRRVRIMATYRGWQPDPGDSNTKQGPPVTRSDWAICDSTGCIYVTGKDSLDPAEDIGKNVNVIGKVRKTSQGQVYLELESVNVITS